MILKLKNRKPWWAIYRVAGDREDRHVAPNATAIVAVKQRGELTFVSPHITVEEQENIR